MSLAFNENIILLSLDLLCVSFLCINYSFILIEFVNEWNNLLKLVNDLN